MIQDLTNLITDLIKRITDAMSLVQELDTEGLGFVADTISDAVDKAGDVMQNAVESATNLASEYIDRGVTYVNDKVQEGIEYVEGAIEKGEKYVDDKVNGADSPDGSTGKFMSYINEGVSKAMKLKQALVGVNPMMIQYNAVGIILKFFNILKCQIEKLILVAKRKALEISTRVMKEFINGKGSTFTEPLNAAISALAAAGTAINAVVESLGAILSMIENAPILNVKASGCCLFMTPKSMKKTDIDICNVNFSVTDLYPDFLDMSVVELVKLAEKNLGIKKKTTIASAAAEAVSSAFDGGLKKIGIENLSEIPYYKQIRTMILALLETVLDADPLPRYEKLNVANIRFLTYLVTGFEPAAKVSFGIPGYP